MIQNEGRAGQSAQANETAQAGLQTPPRPVWPAYQCYRPAAASEPNSAAGFRRLRPARFAIPEAALRQTSASARILLSSAAPYDFTSVTKRSAQPHDA